MNFVPNRRNGMERIRLVECISTPNNTYIQLKNEEVTESLKESFSKAGIRLQESAKKNASSDELIRDLESLRLQESVNSDVLERVLNKLKEANVASTERKYYKFPIGRYGNVNANNRVYTRKLWENVMMNQQDVWKGLCGLCDHPEGDSPGYFRDSSIVWLDMEIGDDGIVYGIGTFVGPYGHLAQEIIDCGGKIGFSSSGFGEVGPDKVVNPATYQIERVADIVLNPSQSVYGDNTAMNLEYNKSTPVAGTGEGTTGSLHESAPKSSIIHEKEKSMTASAINPQAEGQKAPGLSKAEEKAFVKYVNSFLKEADSIKNPSDRLKEIAEILETFDEGAAPDLRKMVEEKLVTERGKLETMIRETVEFTEEFGVTSLKEFSEGAKAVALEAQYLNEENVNYKELCEKVLGHNKALKQENMKLSLKLKLKENKIERTSTARNELSVYADTKIEALTGKLKEATEKAGILLTENKKLSEGNNDLEKRTESLKKRLTIALTERDETTRDMVAAATELKALRESAKAAKAEIAAITAERAKLQEKANALASSLAASAASSKKLNETLAAVSAENEQLSKVVTQTQLREARMRAEADVAKKNLASFREQVEADNTPDAHVMPKFESRVNGYLNLREDKGLGVEAYWADLYETYGENLMPYERQIRTAKTLREAQSAFIRVMKFVDSDAHAANEAVISEAVRQKDRKRMLENTGYKNEKDAVDDLDAVNQRFLKSMPKDFN